MRKTSRTVVSLACLFTIAWLSTPRAIHATSQTTTAAVAPLPATLNDSEFWKLVTDLSEPNGRFASENYVGNELSFQWVIPALRAKVKPGGVYMGVGPDQNFTYIAALQPKIVFIVDVREGNLLQLLMYKALMELSADRVEFAAKLFGRATPANVKADASANDILQAVYAMPADRAIYMQTLRAVEDHLTKAHGFPLSPTQLNGLEGIFGMFFSYGPGITYQNGNGGRGGNAYPTYWDMQVTDDNAGRNHAYMQTAEQFQTIKRLETANLIVPIIGNFGGPKAVRAVGSWVREHGGTVTTFYTSNVEQYLFQDNIWQEWYRNVATLPLDSTSQFIRSAFNMGGGGGGLRSAQLTCGIQDLLAAFSAKKINSYYDVLAMSR